MAEDFTPIEISPQDGGRLATDASLDNVGAANYALKQNFYREDGDERTREGWTYLRPNGAWANLGNSPLFAGVPIMALVMARRPNGQTALLAASRTTIYKYVGFTAPTETSQWQTIGSGFSPAGSRWQVELLNGYCLFNNNANLVQAYRIEWEAVQPLYELREVGVAKAGCMAVSNGQLMLADITEIATEAGLAEVMNSDDPYGLVPGTIATNRIGFRKQWSLFGEPLRWGTEAPCVVRAGDPNINLKWPARSFSVGDEILILGVGQAGVNLTTTITEIHDGRIVVADNPVVAMAETLIAKSDVLDSILGFSDDQHDGSVTLAMKDQRGRLVEYRTTCIFVGNYTGDVNFPWEFTKVHEGPDMLFYRHTLIEVDARFHMYCGSNRYYKFDLTDGKPEEIEVMASIKKLFFDHARPENDDFIYASNNHITNEVWLNVYDPALPGGGLTVAYNYLSKSAGTIDAYFPASAVIERPAAGVAAYGVEKWFVMGTLTGSVVKYGRTSIPGNEVFNRLGQSYHAELRSGLIRGYRQTVTGGSSAKVPFNETQIRSYVLVLSSHSAGSLLRLELWATDNPSQKLELLEEYAMVEPEERPLWPLWYSAAYFQDRISLEVRDNPVRISSRILNVRDTATRSFARQPR